MSNTVDFTQVGIDVAEVDDLTVDKAFEREIPRAGIALVRFVGYIETGLHVPKNPQHKAAQKCILIFELSHKDHLIEINGEKVPQRMYVPLSRGTTDKSLYRKLFKVMNLACDGAYRHFIQMLGTAFKGRIYHNESDKKKVFANLHLDGSWSLEKPEMENPMDGSITPIPVPEVHGDIVGFLWENAGVTDEVVKQMWDSLYIEGTRDDGSSKNWMQAAIQENLEWEGSRTQALTQDYVGLDDELMGTDELADMAQGAGDDVPF